VNIPFSFGDILERIIPGALFLFGLIYLSDSNYFIKQTPIFDLAKNNFIIVSVFLASSYALGVLFNIVADLIPGIDKRYVKYDEDIVEVSYGLKLIEIKRAIKNVFNIEWTDSAWRLCYGIAHKTSYSPNIELFAKLNIFCRSMLVSTILLNAAVVCSMIIYNQVIPFLPSFITLFIISVLFRKGSRLYSQAFSSAVYEAFYTWYCHQRIGGKS